MYGQYRFDDEFKDDVHGDFTPEMLRLPQATWIGTFVEGVTDKSTDYPYSVPVGLLVDSEIVLSTSYGKVSMWCVKFNSTSNVLVCETQRKVNMYGCVSK